MSDDAVRVRERNSHAMRALIDYRTEEPHATTRWLWRCAGADEQLLQLCTHSEHVTYAGLGAFVLVTGVLAALTGGYALFTVFRPTDGTSQIPALLASIVFGLFWGAMIFNLDRYIVASSGKGDGKESISWQELKNAAPRLVLAVVIGMVMSTPLELRLFKREIDVALAKQRIEKMAELEQRDSVTYALRSQQLDSTITAYESELDQAHTETITAYNEMRDEGDGIAGTGRAGAGPRYANKKARYDALQQHEQQLVAELRHRQDSLRALRGSIVRELEQRHAANEKVAAEIGGIVDQIQIAHERGGVVTWVLRLLIILLEVIPVLSKLMYRTGPYDVLQEHLRVMIPARLGVTTETRDLIADGELITRTTELFPMADVVHAEANSQLTSLRPPAVAQSPSVAAKLPSPEVHIEAEPITV